VVEDNETAPLEPIRGWLRMPAPPAIEAEGAVTAAMPEAPLGWLRTPLAAQETAANVDVLPEPRRSWRSWLRLPSFGRRGRIVFALVAGLLVLALGGVAFATYDYSRKYDGLILPGASIAGVDVGGMNETEAVAAVRAAIEPELDRVIQVTWEGRTWEVTPRELGAHGDATAAVREALDASSEASFIDLMSMRVFGAELDFDRAVAITEPRRGVRGFVEGLAAGFDQEAEDATIDYSSGWVKVKKEKQGREIKVAASRSAIMNTLRSGSTTAALKVDVQDPKVTMDEFDQILLLRIGENKLYLYQDGKITHEWIVATGQPEYPTPTGEYEVELKRYMPTWVNPDPTGWGASMPASIPPGPGNPLGLRAINWTAPAIRFHGTSAIYSLGYNASHGCVRMSNDDVIQLYDLIDIGTPIVSTVVAPLRPMYVSAPDPTVVAEDAGEDEPVSDGADAEQERSGGSGQGQGGKGGD
jgi:lipoprotein-anchoring transpeptidase ErfK/SrfK